MQDITSQVSAKSSMQDTNTSWASSIPPAQGLYLPEYEKDACGVGFVVHIKGQPSHKIVSDAKSILCNMTHRGATGADLRDGDGAGVMTAMPHEFLKRECEQLNFALPPPGQYATGNVFLHPQKASAQKLQFESIAQQQGLRVLGWREVPVDSSILGPVAKSKEPYIAQPFVILTGNVFDAHQFTKAIYLLRKIASHQIHLQDWFYICSLSTNNMVYKGQLSPIQVYSYFLDLGNHLFRAHFALVHSRFSTNTFPSWNRAQPLRYCAHNGEINTLRGNKNWMRAREGVMSSTFFKGELEKLYPIIEEGGSDSAAFDNVLELLLINGTLSLPEAVMMMVPEAWQSNQDMDPRRRAFYQWAASLMEPWDGPALFTFFDGRYAGANLDRNGLRPCRFYITNDDRMICASEVGTITIDSATIVHKGRLQPGHMLLVDTQEGRIVDSSELKDRAASRQDFGTWLNNQVITLDHLPTRQAPTLDTTTIQADPRMGIFNFTLEQLNLLLLPMIRDGKEALGSMGNDGALACLSEQPRPVYDYFRQLFAQVTNPPIDPIREEIVMSLECFVGPVGNLLAMEESQCRRLLLPSPILTMDELTSLRALQEDFSDWPVSTIPITFPREEGEAGYRRILEEVCNRVAEQVQLRTRIIILSDRDVGPDHVPISALIALGAVHQHLVRNRQRSKVALVVETGEAREVHHFCALLGYGADAVCPYLALEAMQKLKREGLAGDADTNTLIENYRTATNNGILKVMSKMGISTLQSYKGAQIFEALGVGSEVMTRCFDGTASRIQGATFEIFAREALQLHASAYPGRYAASLLPEVGEFHWRKGGEQHINVPSAIAHLQDAVQVKNSSAYEKYATECRNQIRACTLRGLLDFDFSKAKPVPLDEVEPWTEIVKRFCTGAMSYGSISLEAHSALAAAMNQLGGKSNTGEGGEDPERSLAAVGGLNLRSAIKQVASGRFGVTSFYLSSADELQIKMAQGAKPGEGGELPGHKVSESIAKTRKSTAGVGLISPPPHHDIYSIEDLKQLIYDLKTANPHSRVSVKLVSEVGVGIVSSGVAKAKADHILISGHDGGTGASRWTGIKHAGLPWELGLAETHQTLVLNDLRGRVVLQTDGQIKTGRDVALACLLGAEEWGFATAPLIAMGCIMMRKCHLNTCPVGIATQDPILREKFAGQPEHVINFFHYVAEEMRSLMAALGFRTIPDMVGRADLLKLDLPSAHPKALSLDLSSLLIPAHTLRPGAATYCQRKQNHKLHNRLDNKLVFESASAFKDKTPVEIDIDIVNTDRALGSTLSYHISKTFGEEGLPNDTIQVAVKGSAGQSFGAFLASGVTLKLEGDANDYVGKGLSGGCLAIFPPKESSFKAEENIIVGNVCLYGATSGSAFFRGMAAERFAVRNSGACAVVEGVGDHGCEYMTGGRVVILGKVGRNFAAGMSGGIAYVLDSQKTLSSSTNHEMVALEPVHDAEDIDELKELIVKHHTLTGSELAQRILASFTSFVPKFIKVMPTDYKRALQERKAQNEVKAEASINDKSHELHHQHSAIGDIEDSTQDKLKSLEKPLDKVRGFVKYKRQNDPYRDASSRLKDWKEVNHRLPAGELKVQAARCMDCGVPFCQSDTGCPIGNIIPKWNDLVFKGQWREALDRLMLTNNFPEFTGRVCPAPCEGACVLGINASPVSIKSIECAIVDRGFQEGWIVPTPPAFRTGKKVAIIGSGPAGLAAADQLNKAGHYVTVYDRNDRAGGLLMYGIPNMKLDKDVVRRRLELLEAEGVEYKLNTHVGKDVPFSKLRDTNDIVLMATGATWPRDLPIPNRQLDGIHFAMDFLQRNTSALLDAQLTDTTTYISAKGKHVVVIGGGDTGCDCIGTSARHGASSITNFELLPQPPETRAGDNPWPQFPRIFKVDYGHAEVQRQYARDPREYCVLSKEFVSDGKGNVKGINIVRVQWAKGQDGKWSMAEVPNSEEFIRADLVLLAMGFLGPEADLLKQAGVDSTRTSAIQTANGSYTTSIPGIFAAGDCRRGQSLVVWGINEGRQAAREIDQYLMGGTYLPLSGGILETQSALSASLNSALPTNPQPSTAVTAQS